MTSKHPKYNELLKACLDKFEEHEIQMLSWGDTAGFFTQQEVMATINQMVEQFANQYGCFFEPEDVFLSMVNERAMLIEIPHPDHVMTNTGYYRTRMAESVHLFKLQRQLFWNKKLEDSKTLVSDFRFVRRARSYPRRDLQANVIKQQVTQQFGSSLRPILDCLLKDQFNLSGFQERSLFRILSEYRQLQNKKSSNITGSIICAGTGSGKTMSFYLPGLTALVEHLCHAKASGVQILAIYPRQELLKDQFYETWKQCRELDDYTQQKLGRKLRIGTMFGLTPKSIEDEIKKRREKKSSGNFEFIHCTTAGCKGKMQWRLADVEHNIERLCCSECNFIVRDDEILLTRDKQRCTPPDILFTTTEMLNQQMVNPELQHLYGIGDHAAKPIMVLMDEVHTYEGTTGAQTAYLLRRWLQMSRAKPHFVGLSATLSDAANFFAMLIGAYSNQVVLLEPTREEMVDEGAEYILLLRGDPVSQTALLSTTIQTSLLTKRILDNKQQKSKGVWGNKTFIFTDDLDINNRLFHALVDAEGLKYRYGDLVANPEQKPLADLRANHDIEEKRKYKQITFGQDWRIASQIGHQFNHDRALLGRTSSQDSGVDTQAEVIVATASLEVGFNDPEVGAVIQHKAPRGVASFLQRKGRAGRSREMRPWLIVVLSEFGRDRYTFQRYEELMNPQIKRRSLPLDNRHIQKMQAALVLLDWLSQQVNLNNKSIWNVFKFPKQCNSTVPRHAVIAVQNKIEQMLDDQTTLQRFKIYLKYALKVDDDVVEQLLWESPRSIMLSVIPTMLRQLKTHWRVNNVQWAGVPKARSPLPEYIPEALFADLNVPDVNIGLARGQHTKWESLSFYQGMREFAPGRLSKRYAIQWDSCDWLIPSDFHAAVFDGAYIFEIADAFGDNVHDEGAVLTDDQQLLQLYRPKEIRTKVLDYKLRLKDKSNAVVEWLASFQDFSEFVEEPPQGIWSKYLKDIKFCLHKNASPVEVVRYSHTTKSTLDFQSGDQRHIDFIWHKNGKKVAIGAKQWVDGICFSFEIAKVDIMRIVEADKVQQSLRILLFKERLNQSKSFKDNVFKANWVYECYMAALATQITDLSETAHSIVHAAVNQLATVKGQTVLQNIPYSLFHSDIENDDSEQKLQTELIELFKNQSVINEISEAARALWQPVTELPDLLDYTRKITESTLAAVCNQTLFTLLNDADERAVLVDIEHKEDRVNIWLTESEQGGCGIIANLADLYMEDPRRILNVFIKHLGAGEYEQVDASLYKLLKVLPQSQALQHLFNQVRHAEDHHQRKEANHALHEKLSQQGFILSKSFLNLLYSRVLRPGSHADSDQNILNLLKQWADLEAKTGLEWALNLFTHTAAHKQSTSKTAEDIFDLHCSYQSVLWPKGQVVRDSELSFYNQFNAKHLTDRLLVKQLFSEEINKIIFDGNLHTVQKSLAQYGIVDVIYTEACGMTIGKMMLLLQEQHIEYYGLWLYPRVIGLSYEDEGTMIRFELPEAVH